MTPLTHIQLVEYTPQQEKIKIFFITGLHFLKKEVILQITINVKEGEVL
jgi:hypothetical protein